ncbi:MAG: tyrosine-type recombinase/integrase [Planctomycetota bacterium]
MASISRDANGTKRVLFVNGEGERRCVRLGTVSVKVAETFRLRVEALSAAQITGTPWDAGLSAWVRDLPDRMHARLARVGLVGPRIQTVSPTLGSLLDRFTTWSSVKPATLAAYRQAVESLREHFGPETPLADLSPVDADSWRKAIVDSGLARATVAKRVHVAKAIFRKAVRWGWLSSSPFADLRAGSQCNPDRAHYVDRDTVRLIMEACPDDEWRAIVALSRYAGLRCPSEVTLLRWGDVNWERNRLNVRSPKTAGHEGHAVRVVPLVPELRPILLKLFEAAEPGSEPVVSRLRDPRVNLRTTFEKIITRAGAKPWPRLFHNMRASCETDWCDRFPVHVVAGWLGHGPRIAALHYLQTRDAHFELATGGREGGAESGAREAQNAAQHPTAQNRTASHESPQPSHATGVVQPGATSRETPQRELMGAVGFEPT